MSDIGGGIEQLQALTVNFNLRQYRRLVLAKLDLSNRFQYAMLRFFNSHRFAREKECGEKEEKVFHRVLRIRFIEIETMFTFYDVTVSIVSMTPCHWLHPVMQA